MINSVLYSYCGCMKGEVGWTPCMAAIQLNWTSLTIYQRSLI